MKRPSFISLTSAWAITLKKVTVTELKGSEAGKSLEHLIFLELTAHRSYTEKDYSLNFWRTKSGMEVDFILDDGRIAVEVKISSYIPRVELHGLMAFQEEHNPQRAIMVCTEDRPCTVETPSGVIEILPATLFLQKLWNGEIVWHTGILRPVSLLRRPSR